jgi:hypothetical protein
MKVFACIYREDLDNLKWGSDRFKRVGFLQTPASAGGPGGWPRTLSVEAFIGSDQGGEGVKLLGRGWQAPLTC